MRYNIYIYIYIYVIRRLKVNIRRDISVLLSVTDMFLYASSHTQLTIRDNICCTFRLEKTIIRPLTTTLKREKNYNFKQVWSSYRPGVGLLKSKPAAYFT